MARAATVTMGCGHTNTYVSPWPSKGEAGWCHRCGEFKGVARVQLITENIDNTEIGYCKTGEITVCYNQEPRWFY